MRAGAEVASALHARPSRQRPGASRAGSGRRSAPRRVEIDYARPMSGDVILYHNPRCSKSRETLALLRDRGVEPTIIKYLDDPPSQKRILELIEMLGMEPAALLRKKEKAYQELGLSEDSSKTAVARAIAAHPVLLERPIVVHRGKARIGRPPENVLAIL